jgi:hypothetical protein
MISVRRLVACAAGAMLLSTAALPGAALAMNDQPSQNWGGFMLRKQEITKVEGGWTVPKIRCTKDRTLAAFWLGIGGVPNLKGKYTLAQAGLDADCDDGHPNYDAWYEYETGNGSSVQLPSKKFPIEAGDLMYTTIEWKEKSEFQITLRDMKKPAEMRWKFSHTESFPVDPSEVSRVTAEAIVEPPVISNRHSDHYLPLTDFGTFRFTEFEINGHPISQPDYVAKTTRYFLIIDPTGPASGDNMLASPGSLGSNGSFDVSWRNAGHKRPAG